MTEPIPITDLTFGVEFEVLLPRGNNGSDGRDSLAVFLSAAGIEARHESLTHRPATYWRITTDASIGGENAEVVSPSRGDGVMRGEEGLRRLELVANKLVAFGCSINRSCGTHVHVGVRDREFARIGFFKELVKTYAKFEPIIDQLVAESRRAQNNIMCRPLECPPAVEQATTIEQLGRVYGIGPHNDRHYCKLNLGAYWRHGTVEFRQHQGTINAKKITNWVKLCLRMVQHATKNTERDGSAQFTTPLPPILPAAPRFERGTEGRIPADELRPRSLSGREHYLIFGYVRMSNPRRYGTQGHANWDLYRPGMTIAEYLSAGGFLNSLRWDVMQGNVWIIDSRAHINADEQRRRNLLTHSHREEVTRIEREHAERVATARAAWEAANGSAEPVVRPPTDAAPATLDGFLELIGAADDERAYFTERQMELNQ